MGLTITVMSYCGKLNFGIVADREQVPEVWSLMNWLQEALEELRPKSAPQRRAKPAPGTARQNRAKRAKI
jgi:diacylglycerol O-acyltransferase